MPPGASAESATKVNYEAHHGEDQIGGAEDLDDQSGPRVERHDRAWLRGLGVALLRFDGETLALACDLVERTPCFVPPMTLPSEVGLERHNPRAGCVPVITERHQRPTGELMAAMNRMTIMTTMTTIPTLNTIVHHR